jgi:hypothetical protein
VAQVSANAIQEHAVPLLENVGAVTPILLIDCAFLESH